VSKNDYGFNIPVFIVNEKREAVSAVNASECSCSTGISPDLVQVRCERSLAIRIRRGFRRVAVTLVQFFVLMPSNFNCGKQEGIGQRRSSRHLRIQRRRPPAFADGLYSNQQTLLLF
jgi:hypothetical protein